MACSNEHFKEDVRVTAEEILHNATQTMYQLLRNESVSIENIEKQLQRGKSDNLCNTLELVKQVFERDLKCHVDEKRCSNETNNKGTVFSLQNRPRNRVPAFLANERDPFDQALLGTIISLIMTRGNTPVKAIEMWNALRIGGFLYSHQDPRVVVNIFHRITKTYVSKKYLQFTWPQHVPTVGIGRAVQNVSVPELIFFVSSLSPEDSLALEISESKTPVCNTCNSVCKAPSCPNFGIPHHEVPVNDALVREAEKFGLLLELSNQTNKTPASSQQKNKTATKVSADYNETGNLSEMSSLISHSKRKRSQKTYEGFNVESEEIDSKPSTSGDKNEADNKDDSKFKGTTPQRYPEGAGKIVMPFLSLHNDGELKNDEDKCIKVESEEDDNKSTSSCRREFRKKKEMKYGIDFEDSTPKYRLRGAVKKVTSLNSHNKGEQSQLEDESEEDDSKSSTSLGKREAFKKKNRPLPTKYGMDFKDSTPQYHLRGAVKKVTSLNSHTEEEQSQVEDECIKVENKEDCRRSSPSITLCESYKNFPPKSEENDKRSASYSFYDSAEVEVTEGIANTIPLGDTSSVASANLFAKTGEGVIDMPDKNSFSSDVSCNQKKNVLTDKSKKVFGKKKQRESLTVNETQAQETDTIDKVDTLALCRRRRSSRKKREFEVSIKNQQGPKRIAAERNKMVKAAREEE